MKNREIKFRAWDETTSNPKMLSWDNLKVYEGRYLFVISNDVTLMQYTGCKDKKGIEIYEGDIISWMTPAKLYPPSDYYEEKGLVYFSETKCGFYVKCGQYPSYDVGNLSLIANVIGNVYEHPNLLP